MSNILSQEEVDVLLKGLSGGEIDTDRVEQHEPGDVLPYDLTSQDRIIRGRMPTFEMTTEKFARIFRLSLSSLLRRVVGVSALSVEMMKFGEFLKTLPVPTSLHIFRMDPLRGSAIFVVESKVIFSLVDILFGGSGQSSFKIEGREFTAIENRLIKRVVLSALADFEKAWKAILEVKITHQRSEINPQFAHIVPLTDVVVVVHFEIEMEFSSGIVSICIPYSMLEPVREKLQAGFQSDALEVDREWANRFKEGLVASKVELIVELGRTEVSAKEVVGLKKGDVIMLDRYRVDPLDVYVEGVQKLRAYPGVYKGNTAIQIAGMVEGKEARYYGTE
ncbi:MAG: flagellar motor switch protein FliM [Syntrophaceae bacterium]|nr:flagellar motor switch protein FliM [Syntrophaceae bacterium]